jgi:transposase
LALIELSVVEQRYRAVLAVERGEPKMVVAAQFGVCRQTLHTWLTRYARDGLAGLMDRTHRPPCCPHQASAEVEARVCELRREHPRWGPRRIAHELAASAPEGSSAPGKSTVHRILRRHGLIEPGRPPNSPDGTLTTGPPRPPHHNTRPSTVCRSLTLRRRMANRRRPVVARLASGRFLETQGWRARPCPRPAQCCANRFAPAWPMFQPLWTRFTHVQLLGLDQFGLNQLLIDGRRTSGHRRRHQVWSTGRWSDRRPGKPLASNRHSGRIPVTSVFSAALLITQLLRGHPHRSELRSWYA